MPPSEVLPCKECQVEKLLDRLGRNKSRIPAMSPRLALPAVSGVLIPSVGTVLHAQVIPEQESGQHALPHPSLHLRA